MKQILAVLCACVLVSCDWTPPTLPHVGERISPAHWSHFEQVEETEAFNKYALRSGDYYAVVTCDKDDKILSVWRPQ